jgi:hypothetical protein
MRKKRKSKARTLYDEGVKDWRISYFKDGKLTRSYVIDGDTMYYAITNATVRALKGERCQVEEVNGPLVFDWSHGETEARVDARPRRP